MTNYNINHMPPKKLFSWVGLKNYADMFTMDSWKNALLYTLSWTLIDLIGTEVGAAAKNVIGIAAGMLDGAGYTSLKGALMARGAREVARLIRAMGGNELSAYGLCHLGDYQATLFSPHSHNRQFGENFIKGEPFDLLAEGASTVQALVRLGQEYKVDLPICQTVNDLLYNGLAADEVLPRLFSRSVKGEFDY